MLRMRDLVSISMILVALLFISSVALSFRIYVDDGQKWTIDGQEYPNPKPTTPNDPPTEADGPYLHWNNWNSPQITYYVNSEGTEDIAGDAEFVAIDTAFATWASVPFTPISFLGTDPITGQRNITSNKNHMSDEKNVVSWYDTDDVVKKFPLDGLLWYGITLHTFTNASNPQLIDVDIIFNDRDREWSLTTFEPDSGVGRIADVQSMVTHEIGHLLGIAHPLVDYDSNPNPDPEAIPSVASVDDWLTSPATRSALQALEMRTLAEDDKDALKYLYGEKKPEASREPIKVPTVFQSIEEAADFASSNQTVEVFFDADLLDPSSAFIDVIVQSGASVKVDPGVKISCKDFASLDIYGNLSADGATFFSPGNWNGIMISSTPFELTTTMKNCTIADATNGVQIVTPATDVTIEDTVIEHKFTVQLGGSGNVTVKDLTVQTDGITISAPAAPLRQLPEIAPVIEPPPSISRLLTNFPNPFNPETWVSYQLASDAKVTIRIYTATGLLVRELDLGFQGPGYYVTRDKAAYWDGRNAQREQVASGLYFYQIQAGDYVSTKKMAILK